MSRRAAFLDVDGTIVRGNTVIYYIRIRTAGLSWWRCLFWIAGFFPRVIYYYLLDKKSQRLVNTALYRNYRGYKAEQLKQATRRHARQYLLPNVYPAARRRIEWHREQGHEVVLVTGSLRPIVEPLAEWLQASALFTAEMEERNGRLTGRLKRGPVAGRRKRELVQEYAKSNHVDLATCYAYADGIDDISMLACVGKPYAVNPGFRLRRLARQRGWEILDWQLEPRKRSSDQACGK